MPEETGLDTAITRVGWQQDTEAEPQTSSRKRAPKKRKQTSTKPAAPPRPQRPEGVGTRLDILA